MKRVLILVEGQTEERFVKDTLQPHLWDFDLSLEPKIVTTKRIVGAAHKKGGGDFSKIERDVRLLLGDRGAVAVTTFFDYYGFPANFPARANLAANAGAQGADALERALDEHFSDGKFRAYIQLHEFEAFLFCAPYAIADVLLAPSKRDRVGGERLGFSCAEAINDAPATCPSARIARLFPGYRKALHGPTAALRTGLHAIREDCPRFHAWMSWLESL